MPLPWSTRVARAVFTVRRYASCGFLCDPVALALDLEIGDLAVKGFHRLNVLGSLCHLPLEPCDAGVTVLDLLLPVGYDVAGRFLLGLRAFLLLLLRLVLRILRGFLASIGFTVHAVPPFISSRGVAETK